jgi:hypothetical protein
MGRNTWVHESNSRSLSVELSLTQLAKTLCLSYYAYVLPSIKSVIRAEPDLPETEEGRGGRVGEGRKGWGREERVGKGGKVER